MNSSIFQKFSAARALGGGGLAPPKPPPQPGAPRKIWGKKMNSPERGGEKNDSYVIYIPLICLLGIFVHKTR